jgi:hypothetical protein
MVAGQDEQEGERCDGYQRQDSLFVLENGHGLPPFGGISVNLYWISILHI